MLNKLLRYAATLLMLGLPGQSMAADLVITTGGPTGTYFKFGEQIAELMSNYGVDIEVASSQGSVQNLKRLLGYEGLSDSAIDESKFYQLALVQGDVLTELRNHAAGNATLEEIVGNIKVVLPLYGEEIHVLAPQSSDYTDVRDLLRRSWTIAGGAPASGTRQTVRSLVRLLDAENSNGTNSITDSSGKSALDAMKAGLAETAIMIAGAPMSLLQSEVSRDDSLRLVPAEMPALYNVPDSPYRPATINPKSYPWLDAPVPTTAVVAMLVAFNYDEDNPNCALIEKTTRAIVDNIERLQSNGHPKWKEFDLRRALERTDTYTCARRGMIQD